MVGFAVEDVEGAKGTPSSAVSVAIWCGHFWGCCFFLLFVLDDRFLEDLSLPQVILVESMWIHRLHGCSTDSMDFFLAVETPKFSFLSPWTVHGQCT